MGDREEGEEVEQESLYSVLSTDGRRKMMAMQWTKFPRASILESSFPVRPTAQALKI